VAGGLYGLPDPTGAVYSQPVTCDDATTDPSKQPPRRWPAEADRWPPAPGEVGAWLPRDPHAPPPATRTIPAEPGELTFHLAADRPRTNQASNPATRTSDTGWTGPDPWTDPAGCHYPCSLAQVELESRARHLGAAVTELEALTHHIAQIAASPWWRPRRNELDAALLRLTEWQRRHGRGRWTA
jgi:hypothetical protein